MRIVGGKWKGCILKAPEGKDVTRPTTDRTREALASSILSACGLDMSDVHVLDAFAGSGAVGFELLSRGAAFVTFCDASRQSLAIIRKNAQTLEAPRQSYAVLFGDSLVLAGQAHMSGAPFGVVFLDPPYAMPAEDVASLVGALDAAGNLCDEALIVYEHAYPHYTIELAGFQLIKSKHHGSTGFDVYRKAAC